jgi:AraC-like DNA-binding protein/mannose-6-phosphate isomerase-like protein (cupin superfamily)
MQTIHKMDDFDGQKLLVLPDAQLHEIARYPLTSSLYITDIGFFPEARYHYRERPEGSQTTIFIYCVEGEGWIMLGQHKKIAVTPNTLLVIPAHTPHTYGADEANPWSIYWFHLKGDAVDEFVQAFTLTNYMIHIPTTQMVSLISFFDECYETLRYKGYSWRYHLYVSQVMRHFLASIALLQGEAPQEEKKNEYIEHSMQYMFNHIQSSITLADLAEHVHLSKPHFTHLFKEVTGYTPMEYFMRLKIQRACQYLDLTDYCIKEVSRNVGIQDPYYFSRVFRKIMRQSPSEYRKIKKG